MREHSDRELWRRLQSGEAEAFAELFRHARPVYNYLFRRTADWATAEDLTSVVFLEAWRRRDRGALSRESALPWLLGVATNVLRNQRRSELRYRRALGRLPALAAQPDFAEEVAERLADEERVKRVLDVLGRLPRREQDVIALCLYAGLSYEEATLALNIPVGSVRSRLSRGRARVRELLSASGHNQGACPEQATQET